MTVTVTLTSTREISNAVLRAMCETPSLAMLTLSSDLIYLDGGLLQVKSAGDENLILEYNVATGAKVVNANAVKES